MDIGDVNFDNLRNLTIGTVEFVSPREIKILLELNAPQSTAINTGIPTLFPKINGFVLIPNEAGALVGIISWIGIEYSAYPKRKGLKDFDLVDLPFPLRKMSINPLGILKNKEHGYGIERGVYSYPSVGDQVVIPTQEQLQAIVENKDKNACIKIGNSPLAANAPVYVDPDKLFGRHIAVLGNTGSGKSCSVAGLIRWSLDAAKEKKSDGTLNARFIILDPNGEYSKAFDDKNNVRKFRVNHGKNEGGFNQLQVPVWMWNSYEWCSISQASGKTQRPLLRKTLRELRNGDYDSETDADIQVRRYLISLLVSLKNKINSGPSAYSEFPGKQNCGEFLQTAKDDLNTLSEKITKNKQDALSQIKHAIETVLNNRPKNKNYYSAFLLSDLESIVKTLKANENVFGGLKDYKGHDEDSPVFFKGEDLPDHLEKLAQEQNSQQYLDYLIMRIRTMLSGTRMSSIIGSNNEIKLYKWLEDYIGKNNGKNGEIAIIDLSLVPSDILHIVISVISRIIFEALQRYRRKNDKVLPTVLVIEEAHNFISKYKPESDELSSSLLCSQSFEKIAKEGRKFGLGLVLSSQRPSELSQTVLSQCNTFLLHRLVNDRDQELVKKLIPDNLGSMLNELPVLPTRNAFLLGWAAPIPILIEMNELKEEFRPKSDDPDFWNVWIGKEKREINWKEIVDEWQNK